MLLWARSPYRGPMDRARAIERLQETYAIALALDDEGRSAEEIAAATGVEPEAVSTLVKLARAKLERLTSEY